MEKERLDLLVVQQGLTDSREKAKRLIMAGQIYDENNQRYDKPGEIISVEKTLHIKGETLKYVSRGGLKLEKAIALFTRSDYLRPAITLAFNLFYSAFPSGKIILNTKKKITMETPPVIIVTSML